MKFGREEISTVVKKSTSEVALLLNAELVDPVDGSTVLLECGLDSLGFAMLVASLEEKLGYDPFVLSDTPTYPTTFGEFIDFYQENQPSS